MIHSEQSKNKNNWHILAASLLYALCLQYYVVQILVAIQFKNTYSLSRNTISDLGNTVCGQYGVRYVCSPSHLLMNISFVLLGMLMVSGSTLLYKTNTANMAGRIGLICMAFAGLGTGLVGLFPEDTVSGIHIIGAALPFVLGNIALLFFGYTRFISGWLRKYAFVSGLVGLISLGLFMTHHYSGLGIGGMERLVAYPQTIWLIVFGIRNLYTKQFRSPKSMSS